jgi:hypothetical protein
MLWGYTKSIFGKMLAAQGCEILEVEKKCVIIDTNLALDERCEE